MGKSTRKSGLRAAAVLGLAVCLGWGCAASLGGSARYWYFANSPPDDAWSHKIELWQARERADHAAATTSTLAPVGASADDSRTHVAATSDLQAKYDAFRAERKRALARDLAEWIQGQAKEHYIEDGPIDHWATLEETFRNNGDDCDGLELLVYFLLRDLGFTSDEVFRAIVYRNDDTQHHMVTLWFEDAEDPWVIDPTGAMTSGMPRMSEVPGWTPLKVFSEDHDYTVRPQQTAGN
jgi:hypothetical protein